MEFPDLLGCVAGRLAVHVSSFVLLYCTHNRHQVDVIGTSDTPCSLCMNGGDDDGERVAMCCCALDVCSEVECCSVHKGQIKKYDRRAKAIH